MNIDQRLWGRTVQTEAGCWEFQGARASRNGYGRITHKGTGYWAHRLAYKLAHGEIPDGLHVLHSCDNPPCINPAHLSVGTHQDNMRDKVLRGRNRVLRGDEHRWTRLRSEAIPEIRAARAAGEQWKSIAQRYGMSPIYISRVARGLVRTDVTPTDRISA